MPRKPSKKQAEPIVAEPKAEIEVPIEIKTDKPAVEEVREKTRRITSDVSNWIPKTDLGRKVRSGDIKDINEILDAGLTILEPEIVDTLLPELESELIKIGQSKGKFGGGKRSIWKQTQKKTKDGNKPKFAALAIVGNKNGILGIGYGKAKETVPAREKAIRNAKLNLIKIARGCGSWECGCREPHSIPFKIIGKTGSVIIKLVPAAKGTGLKVEKECQKLLAFTGIKDIYSKSFGQSKVKFNMINACFKALKESTRTKIPEGYEKISGLCEGIIAK